MPSIMRTIRAPDPKQATTLVVAVKCRPLTPRERSKCRNILKVENKTVVVSAPDMPKEYVERVHNRSKERRYTFDHAFGSSCTNFDVYVTTIAPMIPGVIQGLNATIFAYGATGSGKTYTMAGTKHDPGLMVLSLQTIFNLIAKEANAHDFEVTCSYLEVYNEVIYDLLERSSGHLELREDPDQGIMVAGLRRMKVHSPAKIFELLNVGNSRRKTESTEANATSSRSHAVLEITVKRQQKHQYRSQILRGKLALVDLAGSERASETNNAGKKLRDGANINRSLLALANCINALGKQQKKGFAYVPYRNSKLTRILKDGLSGNSRTVMIATVSPADDQYHHTINTLKYADRAKEIKTHIQKNIGTVDSHVADYQRMIDNLQVEVCQLKKELEAKESELSVRSTETAADNELSWLDILSRDTNENVEERINLQKALFELEDINLHNRIELQKLDDLIAKQQHIDEQDRTMIQALSSRRQVILDNIRDNDELGANYQKEIQINEQNRHNLQQLIDEAIHKDGNKTYLRILSQYRLLGMTNIELQFQIAIRDQIIHNQREAQSNLWALLVSSGLDHKQIMEIATKQGITIEDWIVTPVSPDIGKQSRSPMSGKSPQASSFPQSLVNGALEKSFETSSKIIPQEFNRLEILNNQGCMYNKCPGLSSDIQSLTLQGPCFETSHVIQNHSSLQMVSHLHSPSALLACKNGNFMKRENQHWSAEAQVQHFCAQKNVHMDPSTSQTSNCQWTESYNQPNCDNQSTQPCMNLEKLHKDCWHVNNEASNLQTGMERRKTFTNYITSKVDNIHAIQKGKTGKVLFHPPSLSSETYFIHNENTSSVSCTPNSHHIVYNRQSTYFKSFPVFTEMKTDYQDQDCGCGRIKYCPGHGSIYSANPQCQLWPG